ncbi:MULTISPECIES: DNA sulfur modification protein DndB [unclassified Exiguobacterium]|uniref:DNA sulfur modification protein DndB n=1 Tax=unclassified Exiguobacterium TaxID=2644629 RepID=UPI001BE500B0|nr:MULTISPECIES: DNA sulfur modification protein DndB [unclassified Exiguobacterium]
MDPNFSYNFPALRGKQAEKEYFVVMCPLKLIPKIFLFDEEEVPPQYRSQRILNKSRVPDITNYIVDQSKDYVFSSLTASIDGEIQFTPFSDEPNFKDLGKLSITLDSRFLINDGQHRRAAIEEALKIMPELGNETISVVFFHDEGLERSQQIFSDLNRHAVNTTSSIGILYDHRDQLSLLTKEIVEEIPLLKRYTEMEKTSLSKNSPKLLALNHIYNANKRLINKKKGALLTEEDALNIKTFWLTLCNSIHEWEQVFNKEISPRDLRMISIAGQGLFIEAAAEVARSLIEQKPDTWTAYLTKFKDIDWSRSNEKDWKGRAFNENGRILKNNYTIRLTAIRIKSLIGIKLTKEEKDFDQQKSSMNVL